MSYARFRAPRCPAPESTLILAIGFALAGLLGPIPAHAVTDNTLPTLNPGEIQLQGTIWTVKANEKKLVLDATTVSLPSGKTIDLPAPRPKTIMVDTHTVLQVRGSAVQKLSLSDLHEGLHAVVTGKDLGVGKVLPARELDVWETVEDGVFKVRVAKPGTVPAPPAGGVTKPEGNGVAQPLPPPPLPGGTVTAPAADHPAPGSRATPAGNNAQPNAGGGAPQPADPGPAPVDTTPVLVKTLTGATRIVWSVAFSPTSNVVASGGLDGNVRVYNADTGDLLHTEAGDKGIFCVAFSPDGKTIASAGNDGAVKIWSPDTEKVAFAFGGNGGPQYTVTYSPEGGTVASAGPGKAVQLWDLREGNLSKTVNTPEKIVGSVLYSPDGALLAVALGSSDPADPHNTITLFNAQTGQAKQTIGVGATPVKKIAFSPDGQLLAGGGADGAVKVWNVQTGDVVKTFQAARQRITSIAFSADNRIATGDSKGHIGIWDPQTGVLQRSFGTPKRVEITSLAFSHDGSLLASSSFPAGPGDDGAAIRVWKLR